jgi:uncharacterized membrane protein
MKTTTSTKLTAIALATTFGLAFIAAADTAQLPPASTKTGVNYVTDIKPVLDQSCVKCHSGEKPKAKLKLDSLENALKGGRDGKVVTVGDSTNSFIVKCVAHTTADHDLWMPPHFNRVNTKSLTPEQISLIRAWIDQGAK